MFKIRGFSLFIRGGVELQRDGYLKLKVSKTINTLYKSDIIGEGPSFPLTISEVGKTFCLIKGVKGDLIGRETRLNMSKSETPLIGPSSYALFEQACEWVHYNNPKRKSSFPETVKYKEKIHDSKTRNFQEDTR